MLVLTRKLGEKIVIGDRIVLTVAKVEDGLVRLGIEAPREVLVLRAELDARRRPPGAAVDPPAARER